MDYIEVSAKTVNDAITEACQKLGVVSDKLEVEVIEEGSAGFLGIGSKNAVIRASVKVEKISLEDHAKNFLNDVFAAMKLEENQERLNAYANMKTKNIGEKANAVSSSSSASSTRPQGEIKPGSMRDKANMVKRFNESNNNK